MNEQVALWDSLTGGPDSDRILRTAMERVAHGLSEMVGQTFKNDVPRVKRMTLPEVTTCFDSPETEAVGVYLEIESGLRGRAILLLPIAFAFNLADLVMGAPRGTSTSLGEMEKSALAEIGNLTLSYFLNAVAEITDRPEVLQPSPPVVIVDMLGAILNIIIAPAAAVGDELLVVETTYRDAARTVRFCFWVSPDPAIF